MQAREPAEQGVTRDAADSTTESTPATRTSPRRRRTPAADKDTDTDTDKDKGQCVGTVWSTTVITQDAAEAIINNFRNASLCERVFRVLIVLVVIAILIVGYRCRLDDDGYSLCFQKMRWPLP